MLNFVRLHKVCFCCIGLVLFCIFGSYGYFIAEYHRVLKRLSYTEPTLIVRLVQSDRVETVNRPDSVQFIKMISDDSVQLKKIFDSYNNRVERLEKAIVNQREENNTIVDRSSAWLSFWLAFFAVILTIPGIYSGIQTYKDSARNKESIAQMHDATNLNNKQVSEQMNRAEESINKFKSMSNIVLKESRITSLLSCINHILEPDIYGRIDDKNAFLSFYLEQLNSELEECINFACTKDTFSKSEIRSFPIIIFELQLIFSKMSLLNHSSVSHVALYAYLDTLSEERKNMMETCVHRTDVLKSSLMHVEEETKKMIQLFLKS